jgi:hypothetical protein
MMRRRALHAMMTRGPPNRQRPAYKLTSAPRVWSVARVGSADDPAMQPAFPEIPDRETGLFAQPVDQAASLSLEKTRKMPILRQPLTNDLRLPVVAKGVMHRPGGLEKTRGRPSSRPVTNLCRRSPSSVAQGPAHKAACADVRRRLPAPAGRFGDKNMNMVNMGVRPCFRFTGEVGVIS